MQQWEQRKERALQALAAAAASLPMPVSCLPGDVTSSLAGSILAAKCMGALSFQHRVQTPAVLASLGQLRVWYS